MSFEFSSFCWCCHMNFAEGHTSERQQTIGYSCMAWEGEQSAEEHPGRCGSIPICTTLSPSTALHLSSLICESQCCKRSGIWRAECEVTWLPSPCFWSSQAYRAHSAPSLIFWPVSAKLGTKEKSFKDNSFSASIVKMGGQEDRYLDSFMFVSHFWSRLQWDAESHRSQPKYSARRWLWEEVEGKFEGIQVNNTEYSVWSSLKISQHNSVENQASFLPPFICLFIIKREKGKRKRERICGLRGVLMLRGITMTMLVIPG